MTILFLMACLQTPNDSAQKGQSSAVHFTWMGVTNWLVETPDSTILLDAYFSRPADGAASEKAGIQSLQRYLDWAGVEQVDHIVVGHSHFDHALDAGTAALATGAHVWGSATTCWIAMAQGLNEKRCSVIGQGDELSEMDGVQIRVARSPHWWPTVSGIGTHATLDAMPESSEVGDAPHGGVLTMHLDFGNHGSVVFQNTLGPLSEDDGSGEDYAANLAWLMEGQGAADVWLACPNCTSDADSFLDYFSIFKPRVLVGHHWDNALQPPENGLMAGFIPPPSYDEAIDRSEVDTMIPSQLFERYELRDGSWARMAESPIQSGLGLDPEGP